MADGRHCSTVAELREELAAVREAHRGLQIDHRAMQGAFLDLLARVQRLENREEQRTFAGAVSDLRAPAGRAASCGREVPT